MLVILLGNFSRRRLLRIFICTSCYWTPRKPRNYHPYDTHYPLMDDWVCQTHFCVVAGFHGLVCAWCHTPILVVLSSHSCRFLKLLFFPIDGGATLVKKELVLRLMSEIGLLGFWTYSIAVEQRVDILTVLTIPGRWLVLDIWAAFCHCAKLKKIKMAYSHMRRAANRLWFCLQGFGV